MSISFNIFQLFILFGAINGFTCGILVFIKKQIKWVHVFLAIFVLLFALASVKIVLQEKIPYFNHQLPFPLLYQFAFGPLLYLYLKAALKGNYRFSARHLWHFLPVLVFDVVPAIYFFRLPLQQYVTQVQKLSFLSDILASISFSIYAVISLKLIRRFKTGAGVKPPSMVTWAKMVTVTTCLIAAAWQLYIGWVIFFKGRLVYGLLPYYPIYLVIGFCVYTIGIAGYRLPEIGLLQWPETAKRTVFTKAELATKVKVLQDAMQLKQLHRDENMSLQKLAKHLVMPVNELSYIINTGFGMHFRDFLNKMRVEDFKRQLAKPGNNSYTLLSLAYDAGFNSKASFYRGIQKIRR